MTKRPTVHRLQSRLHLEGTLRSLCRQGWEGLLAAIPLQGLIDVRYPSKDARSFVELMNRAAEAGAGFRAYRDPLDEVGDFWESDWGGYVRQHFGLERMTFAEFAGI